MEVSYYYCYSYLIGCCRCCFCSCCKSLSDVGFDDVVIDVVGSEGYRYGGGAVVVVVVGCVEGCDLIQINKVVCVPKIED